jgi:hypothetical protein
VTSTQRIALIYGLSIVGAAGVAYVRGRTEVTDMVPDALVHGIAVGTVLNLAGWFLLPNGQSIPLFEAARSNGMEGLGKLGAEGVKALAKVNVDKLYADMKSSGIKVGPIPPNPSIIVQDAN